MDSIEQKLSRFPARNGFKTVYKEIDGRLQVKQIREDQGTLNSFTAKGWKEYIRAAQPFEAKQFQPRQSAEDQIAELRKMQAELKREQERAAIAQEDQESPTPKKRGPKPKEETAE